MYFDPAETGKRIKQIREKMGYNQEDFAEKLHTSRNYVSKMEIGYKAPSIDMLVEISVLADVSLDYLILGRKTSREEMKSNVRSLIDALSLLEKELRCSLMGKICSPLVNRD